MKSIARSLIVILVALIAVPALAVSYTIATAVQLLATTALIMGGTEHPLDQSESAFAAGYMEEAVLRFINPSATETAGTPQATNGQVNQSVAVIYPAQFFPVFGTTTFDSSVEDGVGNLGSCLDLSPSCDYNEDVSSPPNPGINDDFAVFGYSQSSVIASLVKRELIDNPTEGTARPTSFVLAANPMRPNGGILGRGFEGMTIPIIGITFYGATPTNSTLNDNETPENTADDFYEYPTVDIAQQYDFLGGDAPARPLNFLALGNSIMAYALLHGDVPTHSLTEDGIIDQGSYGDTHYYMIPADTLPLLQPLVMAGVPAPALAIPDAILRVWIEDAYVRNESPGKPVGFQWSPIGNPIGLIGNTLGAIPVGIDDTVEGFTTPGNRPLGTTPAGPFGVGGPDPDELVTLNSSREGSAETLTIEPQQAVETDLNKEKKAGTFGNVIPEGVDAPDGTNRRPFERLRDASDGDSPRPLAGLRPNGEGPLKKIVNALTGQRPESGDDGEASNTPPKPAEPAA